jgi:hypothetical protein
MIRESLNAGAIDAVVSESPNQSYFMDRLTTGASSNAQYGSFSPYPNWMQLKRVGNTFTGYATARSGYLKYFMVSGT